jgi:GMC oxidoreductase
MNIASNSPRASFYKSKLSKYLAGREVIVPSGRCLGGGSSINFMVYSRPQAIDFDAWNVKGWTGKDMIPMFKKVNFDTIKRVSSHRYYTHTNCLGSMNDFKTPSRVLIRACTATTGNFACLQAPTPSLLFNKNSSRLALTLAYRQQLMFKAFVPQMQLV